MSYNFFYDAFNDYYLKNKTTYPDGEGGYITTWEDGAVVKMSLDLGNSSEIRQAESQNLKTVFTASFPIDTPVTYDNYLEDVETGVIYRITSDPKDNKTPPTATYQACYATAVRTELPG